MITETQAANAMGGKTARACNGCVRRRARWYCAADDAFLCQSCDLSVHSANQVAGRHERVRLRTSSSSSSSSVLSLSPSSSELKNNITTAWYQGFTRKARTPRNKKCIKVEDDENSNSPLVPELESEEWASFSLPFSAMEENDESSNCRVPVFDKFLEVEEMYDKNNTIDESYNFCLVPNINGGEADSNDAEKMDDELDGFLPSNFDLAEFTMDVESLLGEEYSCVDVKEKLGFLEFKDENVDINNNNSNKVVTLKGVKNEEEELDYWSSDCEGGRGGEEEEEKEEKCENEEHSSKDEKKYALKNNKRMFLRLDYEAVIAAWDSQGSPWTTSSRPEFSPGDCRPECMLQGYMCPKHILSGFEETTAVGLMGSHQQGRQVASDGEREARVLRYKEKRRTRLFAKKIRYEVRKLNAEKRPRIKGRFVKRTSLLGGTH